MSFMKICAVLLKDVKNELKYLNWKESEIITKLQTEHINLNHYLFTMNIMDDFNCKRCKGPNIMAPEMVSHFFFWIVKVLQMI